MIKYRFYRLLALVLIGVLLAPVLGKPQLTLAAPTRVQLYYLSMPEDDAMQMFYDDGDHSALSPLRSVTSIAIATTGTVIYYDQWENGYAADIVTGADQIWGDGNLANGCPPNKNNTPNPCLTAVDDQLNAGNVVVLSNNVVVNGNPGGPYSRNANQVYYDGRDKLQAIYPVAVTRALWPLNVGSLQAGGVEMIDTTLWGNQYISPYGEGGGSTGLFEDVRLFIMAGPGGSTINLDLNDDGDTIDAGELTNYVMTEGGKYVVDGPQARSKLTVVSGSNVQANVVYADTADTYELRWSALLPRSSWTNNYYTPVGTATGGTGCTNVWVYNPGAGTITVNYTIGNGTTGTFPVGARSNAASPQIPNNYGAHFYTANTADVFLPFSVTDCTGGGQIMDWDTPLFPSDKLTPDLLVGWAPGCTDESHLGVCRDADGSPNLANSISRNVVWVTPLNTTTVYVDTNGSGITCPGGAGAEQTIAATALYSYKINNDPTSQNNVRDEFETRNYTTNGPNNSANWSSAWTESGDDGSATTASGSMLITNNGAGNDFLQFQNSSASNEANDSIQRTRDLTGQIFARFSFQIQSTTADAGEDRLVAEVSPNGGTSWYTLQQFDGPTTLSTMIYNISPYISANTTIRFRFVDNLEAGDIWQVDNVNIQYAPNGDFDMTGSYIRTCDGIQLAAAYGQDPTWSESSDFEALDLGTVIVPYYGSLIDTSLDKQVSDDTPDIGSTVTFSLLVANARGRSTATNVDVTDVVPNGYAYVSGSISGGDVRNDSNPYTTGLTWTIFTLNPGANTTLTYQAVVLGGASMYDNYAEINDADQPDVDSTPGNGSSTEDDNDSQAVIPNSAVIGNSVWLDEDGDGYQDAGEAGLANITVQLWNTNHTSLLASTVTDANGNYIFQNVASGTYQVDVLNSSLPSGLVQTQIPGGAGDFINKVDPYTIVVTANSENMQADFGFNWAPSSDTGGNMGTGAIGDRLWIDDGDGVQEPGEPGLYNLTVELLIAGADGIFGTSDDVVAATTSSSYDGSYIFDNLAAGAYVVRVNGGNPFANYTQVGDPDQPGAACVACDNRTTAPIPLAPGDVYVNADFGYQPNTGYGGNIGDTLWLDANRNNAADLGEQGLAGVTVALIRDLGGDGVWDAGESIIASDVTDSNGQYLFTGLPVTDGNGTDDYLVWVNDTENVLFGLTPTYDNDSAATPNLSAATNLAAGSDLNQDFAYAPPGHATSEGVIGDTIFYDLDAGNDYDYGEGLEGVRVNLYWDTNGNGNFDTGEPLIFTTLTNENGSYFFGNLPAGNFVVMVDTATLPTGVTNTVDPGGISPLNESGVTLAPGGVNLTQDFGYRDNSTPNTISGTLWQDTDANGTLDGGEMGRFVGIPVILRNSQGNIIATTTTDANGNYTFSNLPDGTYTLDVSDDGNLLNGYWHSDGTTPGADNNSQGDPYTVTVIGGQSNTTADFGYYMNPAVVGNYIWLDRDNDGVQDADEPGIKGVPVTLSIAYPNGDSTSFRTLSGPGGLYSFGNLLLDENYDGVGAGEPVYTISADIPPSMTSSPEALPGNNDQVDGDSDGTSEIATILEGEADNTYDFGFNGLLDLGDLPSNYPTLFSPGAANVVFPDGADGNTTPDTTVGRPAIWLGLTVDTELEGQPSVNATGDGPDEDGVVLAPRGWLPGSSSTLTITLNSSESGVMVYFGLWIDWGNGSGGPPDGTFDAFYSGSGVTGSPVAVPVLVSVPGSYTAPNHVYFRTRVYDAPLTPADYQGSLVNGEVEDYLCEFLPTAVELTSLSAATRPGGTLPWLVGITLLSSGLSLVIFLNRRKPQI